MVPSRPAKREVLTVNMHCDRRFVDRDVRQRRRILDVGDGLADGDAFDSRDGDDVTQRCLRSYQSASGRKRRTAW